MRRGARDRHAWLGVVVAMAIGPLAVLAIGPDVPMQALTRLRDGNARFVSGASLPRVPRGTAHSPAGGALQPFATVLSCADSRVPPEFIFDAAAGELVVIRVAGGIADQAVLATVEHAVGTLRTPLLVVMGHDACDTVRSAAAPPAGSQGPHRDYLLRALRPAVERSREPRPGIHCGQRRWRPSKKS